MSDEPDKTEPGLIGIGPNTIVFTIHNDETEVLRISDNGDILYRGRLIENDRQIAQGLREFLQAAGHYPP